MSIGADMRVCVCFLLAMGEGSVQSVLETGHISATWCHAMKQGVSGSACNPIMINHS